VKQSPFGPYFAAAVLAAAIVWAILSAKFPKLERAAETLYKTTLGLAGCAVAFIAIPFVFAVVEYGMYIGAAIGLVAGLVVGAVLLLVQLWRSFFR
jgi:hypothetical protein